MKAKLLLSAAALLLATAANADPANVRAIKGTYGVTGTLNCILGQPAGSAIDPNMGLLGNPGPTINYAMEGFLVLNGDGSGQYQINYAGPWAANSAAVWISSGQFQGQITVGLVAGTNTFTIADVGNTHTESEAVGEFASGTPGNPNALWTVTNSTPWVGLIGDDQGMHNIHTLTMAIINPQVEQYVAGNGRAYDRVCSGQRTLIKMDADAIADASSTPLATTTP